MTDTKTKPWTHNYIQRWNPPNRSLRLPTQKQELDHRELTGPHSHRLPGFLSCLTKHCCCCPVIKPCLTFWKPMDCSTLGFPVLHYLPEFAQTHAYGVGDAIQPSHPLSSPFILPLIFPTSGFFPVSQFFTSRGQSTGALVLASVLPMNIQGWFPLGLTGLTKH